MKVTIEHLIDKNGKIDVKELRSFIKEHLVMMDKHPIPSCRFATKSVYDAKDWIKQVFFWTWNNITKQFEEIEE